MKRGESSLGNVDGEGGDKQDEGGKNKRNKLKAEAPKDKWSYREKQDWKASTWASSSASAAWDGTIASSSSALRACSVPPSSSACTIAGRLPALCWGDTVFALRIWLIDRTVFSAQVTSL
jgi:hypothetical protein